MDPRFEVQQTPRPVPRGLDSETPLLTLAWRALHGEHQERAELRERQARQMKRVEEVLIAVAEEVYALRRLARTGKDGTPQPLLAMANRLEQVLAKLDVDVVAPEGEAYTSGLMELLESTAQHAQADLKEPRVLEVITPAVLQCGALLRMGKAVIGVPVSDPAP
jgi:hypothetical protein